MILGFKKSFEDGTPTDFKEKILQGHKIHSLRSGSRWDEGMSIHMAHGVRTKQYEQFNADRPDLQKCVQAIEIFMTCISGRIEITLGDNKYLYPPAIEKLICNDGLTSEQFHQWFFPDGDGAWSGQIIHWTDFKY